MFSPSKVFNCGQTEKSTATQKWSYFTYLCLSVGKMLRTSSLVYFFLQFSLSILPVFNWVHRRHSCLLPFIHQLHSPVPVYTQQEFNWVAGLLHEASHYAPTLLPGGSSQGWLSPCDTPGEGSVKAAPGFQGMQVGHLAGNFVLCCSLRCFLCQQSSYFWLSQISCECPP